MSKFCTNCGTPIEETTTVCLNCGVLTGNKISNNKQNKKKKGLPTWAIILIVLGSVLIVPILLMVIGGFVAYRTLSTSSQQIIENQLVSTTKELTTEMINEDVLDGLTVEEVTLDKGEVVIKGSQEEIEQVVTVKAIINLEDIDKPKEGTNTIDDISLVAYDELGNNLDVEIVPNKITATVTLASYSANVKIKVIPTGTLEYGKAISSITASINTVTIYGDEETISKYAESYIPVEVDIDGLSEDKTFTVDIDKPDGITKVSEDKITVTITLGEETTKEIEGVRIEAVNLGKNLKASAIGENSTTTTVVIKGTEEVLNTIDYESIKATVDLTSLGEGEHEVEIKITGDNTLATYTSKTMKVKIKISK